MPTPDDPRPACFSGPAICDETTLCSVCAAVGNSEGHGLSVPPTKLPRWESRFQALNRAMGRDPDDWWTDR